MVQGVPLRVAFPAWGVLLALCLSVPDAQAKRSASLYRIGVGGRRGVVGLLSTGAAGALIVETTGPEPEFLAMGPRFRVRARQPLRWRLLARDDAGKRLLGFAVGRQFETVSRHNLEVVRRTELKAPCSLGAARGLHKLGEGKGWALTLAFHGERRPNVIRVNDSLTAYGKTGSTALQEVMDSGWDDVTRRLVLVGDRKKLEVFDPESMKSEGLHGLPCVDVGHSLWVSQGKAWIGTEYGRVLCFDLKTKECSIAYQDRQKRCLRIAGAEREQLLAVMAVRGPWERSHDGLLQVFRANGRQLRDPVASHSHRLNYLIEGATLQPAFGRLVMGDHDGLLVWRYGGQSTPK